MTVLIIRGLTAGIDVQGKQYITERARNGLREGELQHNRSGEYRTQAGTVCSKITL